MRDLKIALRVLLLMLVFASGPAFAADRPNILVIYTDDQDFDELGYFGDKVLTPNMDRLFSDGLRFPSARITSPVCTPSRFGLHTGRYASTARSLLEQRGGSEPVLIEFNTLVDASDLTVGKVMQSAGYDTAFIGKWHLGAPENDSYPEDPAALSAALEQNHTFVAEHIEDFGGFDFAGRVYSGNPRAMAKSGGLPKKFGVHNMEWLTEGALEFINSEHDEPYFMIFAPTVPHGPSHSIQGDPLVSPAGILLQTPQVQQPRSTVADRLQEAGLTPGKKNNSDDILWLDDAIGVIVDAATKTPNTLVIFTSDHQRDGKFSLYDDGARVPTAVYWPGVVEPGESRELVANIDILPTVAELAGLGMVPGVDGRSFAPVLFGQSPKARDHLLLEIGYSRGIVTYDGWKYIARRFPQSVKGRDNPDAKLNLFGGTTKVMWRADKYHPDYFDNDQLYDLNTDPDEQTNLADDPKLSERLAKMKRLLSEEATQRGFRFGEFGS